MLNNTTNSRGSLSMFRLDALFRPLHWLGASRPATHVTRLPPVASRAAIADADARLAGVCEELGFSAGDPACIGLGRSGARAAHAAANIIDWSTYLPRDCVRAMVKDGWHWSA